MSAATVRRYDKRTKTEIAEAVRNSSFYNRKQGDNSGDNPGIKVAGEVVLATIQAGKGLQTA